MNKDVKIVQKSEEKKETSTVAGLTQEQIGAINVLIQGVQAAYKKGGVYSMQDTTYLYKAIKIFDPDAQI